MSYYDTKNVPEATSFTRVQNLESSLRNEQIEQPVKNVKLKKEPIVDEMKIRAAEVQAQQEKIMAMRDDEWNWNDGESERQSQSYR